jgi:hypothetical protein
LIIITPSRINQYHPQPAVVELPNPLLFVGCLDQIFIMPTIVSQGSTSALFNISAGVANLGAESNDVTPVWVDLGQNPTNRIITNDQSLTVNAQWTANGAFHLILGASGVSKWECNVYLEAMGNAEAFPGRYTTNVSLVNSATNTYNTAITIPAGLAAGLYRVVYSMTIKHGTLNIPFGGFSDLGFIQVMADF